MNKQLVYELVSRATDRQTPHAGNMADWETIGRFAELIVRECMEVIEKQKTKMSYGPTFVIQDIKKHFGVE